MWLLVLAVALAASLQCGETRSLAMSNLHVPLSHVTLNENVLLSQECSELRPCTVSSYPFCYMEEGQTEGVCLPGEPGKLLADLYNTLSGRTA